MSSLSITNASSMQALTQLRVLSAMAPSSQSNNAATALFGSSSLYALDTGTLTASNNANGFGSGSLATGMISLSNLQNVLTGLQSMAQSAADTNTSDANRAALQTQYNTMLSQANQLVASVGANGITLKSLTSSDSNAVAVNAADLGLTSASWTQASDASADESTATAALTEVNNVLKSFASSASASDSVRATLQSSELSSLFPTSGSSNDLTQEIASLSGLTGNQSFQSIQNYLSSQKAALITSA